MKKSLFALSIIVLMIFSSCNSPKPVKTIENLKDGIIGETTASAKYLAFAEKAKSEGLDTIAKLFVAASKAEGIHAVNHTKVLEELGVKMEAFTPEFVVKTTEENLQAAIDGETYEQTTMYPGFLEAADAEKVEKATKTFTWAMDTEKKHKEFYTKALAMLKAHNTGSLSFGYAVCPVCGNTYEANAVDNACAFCGTPKDKFIMI